MNSDGEPLEDSGSKTAGGKAVGGGKQSSTTSNIEVLVSSVSPRWNRACTSHMPAGRKTSSTTARGAQATHVPPGLKTLEPWLGVAGRRQLRTAPSSTCRGAAAFKRDLLYFILSMI